MKQELQDRLKKYALSAAAAVAGVSASQAQILYTNINPDDTVTGNGNGYLLDLNNDNVDDFDIFVTSFASTNSGTYTWTYYSNTYTWTYNTFISQKVVRINPLAANNRVRVDASSMPVALNNGVTINNGGVWNNYASSMLMAYEVAFSTGYYSSSFSGGNWLGVQDKYLGLRIQVAGQTYYGWARLSVPNGNTFIIKDYAIQQSANTAIVTGDTFTPPIQCMPATNLLATDIADAQNASDMRIQFNHASNETGIQTYRAIIVKDSIAGSFNLAAAQAVQSPNYVNFSTAGSSSVQTLFPLQADSDGDTIVEGVTYRFFVLSKADGTAAQLDTLSAPSNAITLTHAVIPPPVHADTVKAVTLTDIGFAGNGTDMQVSFDKVANENKLSEYRIIIVKAANAGTFTMAQAQTLPAGRYTTHLPNGQNVAKVLFESSRDADGAFITYDVPYRAFVLSLADGFIATANSLSPVSNQLTLDYNLGFADINANAGVGMVQDGRQFRLSSTKGEPIIAVRAMSLNGQHASAMQPNSLTHQLVLDGVSGIYLIEATTTQGTARWKVVVTD